MNIIRKYRHFIFIYWIFMTIYNYKLILILLSIMNQLLIINI